MPIRVGDPIISMRALAPDPCGVLPPPVGVGVAAVNQPNPFSTLPPVYGAYYFSVTYLTPWGESLPQAEIGPVNFGSPSNSFEVTVPAVLPGVDRIRVYFTVPPATAGQEAQFFDFDLSEATPGTQFVFLIDAWGKAGVPPTRPSSYLPDTDGSYVSAAIAYRWLNGALRKMVVQLGGIRDISGVAWPSQAAWSVLSERWTEIETAWWSGWYQHMGRQEWTWLQNPVQSVPGYTTHWANAGRDIMGLWPQPGAGPGSSPLTAPVGLTDTVLNVQSASALQMPGMVKIDDEFILISAPSSTGTQIVGCIRGMGGSVPATHVINAPVTQLITMFSGSRLAPTFYPGQSYLLLQLPAGWDVPLERYMLARYREKEQLRQEAASLDQEFMASVEMLRTSKDAVPKDRQVGDSRVYASFNGYQRSGALPFGILVP